MVILENSYKNKRWILKESDCESIEDHILYIKSIENNDFSLSKSLNEFWPKENEIPDIQKGIEIIKDAILNNKKIGVVGDYDVDGSSATGLLVAYFKEINANFTYYIPNRFHEGYGINTSIISKLIDQNVDIIITVDNGTTAYEAIDFAKKNNKIFIVMDHHHIQNEINIDAFINPHLTHKGFEILCATGVVFIFLVELNKYLYENKIINNNINIYNYIDVVATATICDVMPLIGINRAIVSMGLKKINLKPIPGYKAILEDYIGNIDVQTIGFSLGPCINAPGRLGSALRSVELVIEKDEKEARKIAADLVRMNYERREIEKGILEKADEQIIVREIFKKNSIVIYGEWFEGVIGIIAGRMKDKYNKPVCVLTKNEGMWKGSLRSIEGFHIGDAVKEAIEVGIAAFGGGHEMAGGISLNEDNLMKFIDFFEEKVSKCEIKPNNDLKIDAIISLGGINQIKDMLEKFGPFGPNNNELIFLFPNCIILYKKQFKNSCLLTLCSPNFQNNYELWLFSSDIKIIELLQKDMKINIVGNIVKNKDKIQIKLIDFYILK